MSAGEDFWPFSLRVYGKPGVPPACLALQNDHSLDVNLLLYCSWLGVHGVELDAATLARVLAFATPWSEHVVRPLRQARTWMKQADDARKQLPPDAYAELRESIKTIELAAERLQQLGLEAMTLRSVSTSVRAGEAASCAGGNLMLYASEADVTLDTDSRMHLVTIISAATGVEPAQALEHLADGSGSGTQATND